jgi:hypothetical protein
MLLIILLLVMGASKTTRVGRTLLSAAVGVGVSFWGSVFRGWFLGVGFCGLVYVGQSLNPRQHNLRSTTKPTPKAADKSVRPTPAGEFGPN